MFTIISKKFHIISRSLQYCNISFIVLYLVSKAIGEVREGETRRLKLINCQQTNGQTLWVRLVERELH